MNKIVFATLVIVAVSVSDTGWTGIVNTEAGTFQCHGSVVRLDRQGVPSIEEPDGKIKPCYLVVQIRDTV